jgi:hypothetical protein
VNVIAPLFVFALPIIVVFLGLAVALYWPTRFSLRGLLAMVTLVAIVLGLVAALSRWPK